MPRPQEQKKRVFQGHEVIPDPQVDLTPVAAPVDPILAQAKAIYEQKEKEAAALEAQAMAPRPEPAGTKQMLLMGVLQGLRSMNHPGGYAGMKETDLAREAANRSELLARAKEARSRGQFERQQGSIDYGRENEAKYQRSQVEQAKAALAQRQNEGRYTNVGEGSTVFDTQAGQPVYTNPKAPPTQPTDREIDTFTSGGKRVTTFQRPDGTTYEVRSESSVDKPTPASTLSATGESNVINRLTQQWDKATADVRDLYRANTIMQEGINAARQGNMNAGAQAVLVTFQKFLDPQSVVRESEYARSPEGLAMVARVRGAIDRLSQGGAGVPLAELETFAALAQEINNRLASEGNSLLAKQQERIGRNADYFGVPRDLIFSGFDFTVQPDKGVPGNDLSQLSDEELLKRALGQ